MSEKTCYSLIKEQVHEKALACGRLPQDITIVTVSKTWPVERLQAVYEEGGRDFGESRLQEAVQKISQLPSDCKWHLIGTLQSNKIAKALASFQLIHSVDNPVLARKISEMSQAQGIVTPILLQVNTSGEKTKHGLSGEKWQRALENVNQLSHVRVEGLMTIAPHIEDQRLIRSCFHRLYLWREMWRHQMKDPAAFQQLSMGMSQDFLVAIEEGATLLRIGSAMFN